MPAHLLGTTLYLLADTYAVAETAYEGQALKKHVARPGSRGGELRIGIPSAGAAIPFCCKNNWQGLLPAAYSTTPDFPWHAPLSHTWSGSGLEEVSIEAALQIEYPVASRQLSCE